MPKHPPKNSADNNPIQHDDFVRIHPDPPEEQIQLLYNELHRLERCCADDNAVVLGCRRIMTDAFFLLNHPFDPISPDYSPDLHYAEEEELYFKRTPSPKLPRKVAARLRKELNGFVHSHISRRLPPDKVVDYLNTVRCALDDLFNRNTPHCEETPPLREPRIRLNPRQLTAVTSKSRLTLVNAGPGTGKTHLLAFRLLHSACASRPKQIIGLAYTNEAANALQERVVDSAYGTILHPLLGQVRVHTIHSFATRVILDFHRAIGQPIDFKILEPDEEEAIKTIYSSDYLRQHHLLTFKMILELFIHELESTPAFIDYIRDNIAEIVLDEAQDASPSTAKIIKTIYSLTTTRIFLVGDQRQNIFRFNNGSLHNFDNAGLPVRDEARTFDLVECYRCPQSVLNLANSLSFQNDCPNTPLSHLGTPSGPLDFIRYSDQGAEAKAIVDQIATMQRSLSDIAILVPTSYQFEDFAAYLKNRDIPFRCIGGQTKLSSPIKILVLSLNAIADPEINLPLLLAYLNALPSQIRKSQHQPFTARFNPLAFDYPALPSTDDFLLGPSETPFSGNDGRTSNILPPVEEDVSDSDPYDKLFAFARRNRKDLQMLFCFLDDYLPSSADIPSDAPDLDALIGDFEIVAEKLWPDALSIVRRFHSAVRDVGVFRIEDLQAHLSSENKTFGEFYIGPQSFNVSATEENDQYVTISTIHSAKGREWPIVFLPSLTDGLLPKYQLQNDPATQLDEIKKFYVACTRPSESLILSWVASYRTKSSTQKNKRPPRFLLTAIYEGILTPIGWSPDHPNVSQPVNTSYFPRPYRYQ